MDSFQTKMNRRPTATDTEDDLLQLQAEYLRKKNENPELKPCVQVIKITKPHKKSIFATSRQTNMEDSKAAQQNQRADMNSCDRMQIDDSDASNEGNVDDGKPHVHCSGTSGIVLGDIIEKTVDRPKQLAFVEESHERLAFPKVEKLDLANLQTCSSKSLFAELRNSTEKQEDACKPQTTTSSAIPNDAVIAREVHEENLLKLKQMQPEEIIKERAKLLSSMDPNIIKFLAKKCQNPNGCVQQPSDMSITSPVAAVETQQNEMQEAEDPPLPEIAVEILDRSLAEQWINFNVVEKHKLEWMHDVPLKKSKVNPNQPFEARFDWEGVLLPHTFDNINPEEYKDDRDLYLHGEEPNRPGYTLQELFRMCRTTVVKQRLAGYNAIDGILNIYQQGFYDKVLTLPIPRIFFLIRVGMDSNTPIVLMPVCKALASMLYNEPDEALLDFCFENPNCHWQMALQVVSPPSDTAKDLTSARKLCVSEQLKNLKLESSRKCVEANIIENDEESEASMLDFELAEKDLIQCVLRTDILQRIYYILRYIKPENSAVLSCLKILIRLSRTGRDVAEAIVNDKALMECLITNFLPTLNKIDTQAEQPAVYYNYPQYLCLKLFRVLISSGLNIALELNRYRLYDLIEVYLGSRDDFKVNLIKVQIECLRILRCLFVLHTDNNQQVLFLPIFHMLLRWHYNHMVYESNGPYLLRQHAAAIIMAIVSIGKSNATQALKVLGDILSDCCCNWFNKARIAGVKEFSQSTLLCSCVNALIWYINDHQFQRVQDLINKYLIQFLQSQGFEIFYSTLLISSAVINQGNDRRNVNANLPNFGSVVMHSLGPQLIISQSYPFHLLHSLWHLMELSVAHGNQRLYDALLQSNLKPQLIQYLSAIRTKCNQQLATNLFVRNEIKFIYQLLHSHAFEEAFSHIEKQHIVYNFLNCLTAEFIDEMQNLFDEVIFNTKYMKDVEAKELNRWHKVYNEFIYGQLKATSPEVSLTLNEANRQRLLPPDWPYIQFRQILQNFLNLVQNCPVQEFSERDALIMTLKMVEQLEKPDSKLEICSPTETLMYLMVAFMGSESKFLDEDVHRLLQSHIERFIIKQEKTRFDFDHLYPDKCHFENLYKLFLDHFQAASYADELFSALVMIPLAQKYDKKWRLFIWSEYCYVLPFLTCKESLLIGGLAAYLEPHEMDLDVIKLYDEALRGNILLRFDTLPFKIAVYHMEMFRKRQKRKEVN